jgi:hypothetical protein
LASKELARGFDEMKEGYVNRVLRNDGTVVTLTPSDGDGRYELALEIEQHKLTRTVSSDLANDPLHTPEFESIILELKDGLEHSNPTDSASK